MVDQGPLSAPLNLCACLEALLFVAGEAVTPAHLAAALNLTITEIDEGLSTLSELYQARGLRLLWHAGGVQLTTAPETATIIERFLGLEEDSHLSRAGLETLAMVAYQQPITRPQIDAIRGVNSDGVLKSLLNKGLIQESGRADSPGRPILYCTTPDFLRYFGLNSLNDLPPLNFEDRTVSPQPSKLEQGGG